MNLETMRVPPVSKEFYERLIQAFPPLDPRDIKPDTSMIVIQRNAAQQEMILFIKAAINPNIPSGIIPTSNKPTMWQRIKALLFTR